MMLGSGCPRGIMGIKDIKDGVGLDGVLSLIWLFIRVSLYIWNFSTVSMKLPLPVVYSISTTHSYSSPNYLQD